MLERIQVKGFKSIREMDLELRPLNILIGANGSGKSNFISLFHLLREMIDGHLQIYTSKVGGADRLLHYGRRVTDRMTFEFFFGSNTYLATLFATEEDRFFYLAETATYQSPTYDTPYPIDFFPTGYAESRLENEVRSRGTWTIAGHTIRTFKNWRIYHFHDTSSVSSLKKTAPVSDIADLHGDGGNLSAFLYHLSERYPHDFDRITRIVQQVAPFFEKFYLASDNGRDIRLRWKEIHSETIFDVNSFSDGTLRFIALVTLLMQPNLPELILIDEPELGLHPTAIAILAGLLQSAAAQDSQVIVATQSPTFISHFAPEDIIVVDRAEEQSTFKRFTSQELQVWLDDYTLGQLWEKNILGGRP